MTTAGFTLPFSRKLPPSWLLLLPTAGRINGAAAAAAAACASSPEQEEERSFTAAKQLHRKQAWPFHTIKCVMISRNRAAPDFHFTFWRLGVKKKKSHSSPERMYHMKKDTSMYSESSRCK